MKNKETEIATNVSSGAEKVEVVEKEIKKEREKGGLKKTVKTVKSAKGDAALGDSAGRSERISAKKINAQSSGSRAEKESEAAKARVELAIKKKEEKAKRKEEKAKKRAEKIEARKKYIAEENAKIEKRLAEKKAKAEKHAAERKALAEKRAAEKEKAIRERAHAKANKKQAHARKKSNRGKNGGSEKRESRAKGYGGWIAAVVTLGVTTLALAATVTVGAIEMNAMKTGMTGAQMGTMYELTGIMEHVDDDLDRVRISASPVQQSRILTDLLVQARLAEADLEKLPVPMEADRNITEFINRTATECERMLSKLRNGEKLSKEDIATLESLYKTNHSIREELDKLTEQLTDKDLMDYMKEGVGMVSEALDRLEKMTLEENRAALEKGMEKIKEKGAGMERVLPEAGEKEESVIDCAKAEELCKGYFQKYNVDEYQCVGETVNRNYSAYNVQGFDQNGSMLFAEIDRKSGKLITFDYYEEASAENFDIDNAERIAEEFLESLGYENMTVARLSESGSTADFTFVYEMNGVAFYPDTVHVKVCRTRGLVCGLDATKYLKNHRGRVEVSAKINLETAYGKLNEKLSVEASRLAVVSTARGERTAYEFLCSYEDSNYFVYLDANTGEEIAILNAQNIR